MPVPHPCSCHATAVFKRLVACREIHFKKLGGDYKYGCLMAKIPEPLASEIMAWSAKYINEDHLGPGGREDEIHVTVKYGFKDSSPTTIEGIKNLLVSQPSIKARLGNFSYFDGENPDGWPLFIAVASPDLVKLNQQISSSFPCEDKYPTYKPHVTVAYLDPRFMDSYAVLERLPFQNKEVEFTSLEWSGADGTRDTIKLGNGIKDLSYLSETMGGSLVRPPYKRFRKVLRAPRVKGRWVTMPANGLGGGGTHVYIDNSGEIQKGPRGTVGKEPEELNNKKPEPPQVDKKPKALRSEMAKRPRSEWTENDAKRMTKPLTQGDLNMCFENARKEFLALKAVGKNPKYVVGKLTAYKRGLPATAGPLVIDHAWIEVDGKVVDPSPFRVDQGSRTNFKTEPAERHWDDALYVAGHYANESSLNKPLDDFPSGTPAEEVIEDLSNTDSGSSKPNLPSPPKAPKIKPRRLT